ncbi:LOW QUALITY PROTEIN: hypothetical protein QYF61_025521 [Mycteria americana]|uniref:Kazal-like domain-containing protein n=1 Tax=Mycteria americana TaxID=33587 RepID=A0AAN7MW12_MYCAM|nr:LOW QUALITY PROTEIN: hypothetical protein QYF61_025521 [Mycteria americana]
MLTGPDPLVVLYVPCGGTQDDLLHNLPRHRGQTDGPVIPQILLLALLVERPAFLDSFALQDCFARASVNRSPKQAKVCPPEVQGSSSSADPPPYFSKNRKLVHFVIAMAKTVSNRHITHKSFSIHKQWVQRAPALVGSLASCVRNLRQKKGNLAQKHWTGPANIVKCKPCPMAHANAVCGSDGHTYTTKNHTESQNRIGWKRPLRSSSPTVNLTLPSPPLHHVPKHLIQISFKCFQGWRLNHFPGQPVPMLDNPFSNEIFPNIQSKPPLAQLEAISSCPITSYLGEETDPTSLHPPFRQLDKVSPQPPLLQAKQPQLPQPLPISLVLQTLPQLRCPSLDTLQPPNVSLGVRGPTLNTGFEVRPHQCRVQGHDHCPSPAGHAIPDTSQDAIGLLGHLGTLLAHIQAAVDQHSPRSFSARQLSSHSAPSL